MSTKAFVTGKRPAAWSYTLPFAFMALSLAAALVVLGGCGDDKEAQLQKEREWALHNFSEGETPPPKPAPLPDDMTIEVPQSVKDRYVGVKLAVGDRKTREIRRFEVKLGETAQVPGTDYTVKVGEYLPTWVLRGKVATTKKDEPDDPAVRATIFLSGDKVFDGFLFQRHMTPSFITDKYVIGLIGAVEK